MRVFLKVEIPVEAGNALVKNGKLGETIQAILKEQKPEAAYFTAINGQRTGLIFLNIAEESQIPSIAEPWFLALKASVELYPAMVPEDLAKAGPSFEKAVKKYGSTDCPVQ
ncbi:MAG: hypothetical protein WCO69_00830 [Candidatus Omnitrophota bacterium]